MEAHLNITDAEFEKQFEAGNFPPSMFSHEAHLRLAWIHISKYGEAIAIENITAQLLLFVQHVGAADKYNHTLTIAAIKAVHHFMNRSSSDNFRDFIAEFPRLKNNFRELMNAHYGMNIFMSEEAKKVFLEPDLIPFD